MRKIFGPTVEVTVDWKRLHNEGFVTFTPRPILVERLNRVRWWACGTYRGEKRCIQSFDGET